MHVTRGRAWRTNLAHVQLQLHRLTSGLMAWTPVASAMEFGSEEAEAGVFATGVFLAWFLLSAPPPTLPQLSSESTWRVLIVIFPPCSIQP